MSLAALKDKAEEVVLTKLMQSPGVGEAFRSIQAATERYAAEAAANAENTRNIASHLQAIHDQLRKIAEDFGRVAESLARVRDSHGQIHTAILDARRVTSAGQLDLLHRLSAALPSLMETSENVAIVSRHSD